VPAKLEYSKYILRTLFILSDAFVGTVFIFKRTKIIQGSYQTFSTPD
jgi:hypothetical protein